MGSPEELQRKLSSSHVHLSASPTAYSRIIHPNELQEMRTADSIFGRPILETKDGERFYKLTKCPEAQQFISRVLKSGFPVCDVVKIDDAYYSHAPKTLADIHDTLTREDVQRDIRFISYLTNDNDRYLTPLSKSEDEAENLRVQRSHDSRDYLALYYDFGAAASFFKNKKSDRRFTENLLSRFFSTASAETLRRAAEKARFLDEYWTSPEGKEQMLAASKTSGLSISQMFVYARGRNFEDFYTLMPRRAHELRTLAEAATLRSHSA